MLVHRRPLRKLRPKPSPLMTHTPPIMAKTTPNPSYFKTFYDHLYLSLDYIPSQFTLEAPLPFPFLSYRHPFWTGREEVWNRPPLIIDPEEITLLPESIFQHALFRITLSAKYLSNVIDVLPISQGSTITFRGYPSSERRHVVEWCQWIKEDLAYLKVTGITHLMHPIPHNDPYHPSFILVVPLEFNRTLVPPQIAKLLTADSSIDLKSLRITK